MGPRALRFVKYSYVFNFAVSCIFVLNGFGGVNFKNSIFNGVLNLCQHVIAIPMDYLNGFLNFTFRF